MRWILALLIAFVLVPFELLATGPVQEGGGGGATDLSVDTKTPTTLDVASSTGGDATLPAATDTEAGLQTAAQKSKLDDIPVEFDAIIDISDRTTMCQNWATAVESFMDGTYGTGDYHVAVVGTPSSAVRPAVDFYDDAGAWPYEACFPLHPQDGASPDSPWPDSLGATADVDLQRGINDGIMVLHMLHGEIRVSQSTATSKNSALFDFGNGYMAGHKLGGDEEPWGLLGGQIKVVGESRVVVQAAGTTGYTGGGTVGEGIPEGSNAARFNALSTTTFVPFAFHGATYIDVSEWTIDWLVDDDDIGVHITESWGIKELTLDSHDGGEGVGVQLFGAINGTIHPKSIRSQDYGIVFGGGDLPSGADDDRIHYYATCASGNCTPVERGVRGARFTGGTVEGHSQANWVMIEDEKRNYGWNIHNECGSGCAIGGILYRPRICDGTGTTPVATGKPLGSDAAEATACAASGGNANTPEEPESHFTIFSMLGTPMPEGPSDDVPNLWFGSGFTDRLSFVIADGSELGTMTATSTGDDASAPFKVSTDVDCDSVDGCGKVFIGATDTTGHNHSAAPAGVPHVAYDGLVRSHPLDLTYPRITATDSLTPPGSTTLPATCTPPEIHIDTDATSGQRIYLCESTNTWVLQGDGGVGGGDAVSIDGVAATDPDFTSDGDIDRVRCTGVGVPDASCVAAEDVNDFIKDNSVDKAAMADDAVGDDELDYSELADLSLGGQVADDSHSHVIGNIDAFSSADLRGRLTDEEGTGNAVFEGGSPTFSGLTIDPSATPGIDLKDSNATAGDVNARWEANCTDVGDGTEDCDTWLESQTAGTTTTRVFADADGPVHIEGGNAYIGPNATPSTPATATGEGDLFVEDALEVDGATDLDSSLDVAGTATLEGLLDIGTVETFGNPDTTPDVSTGIYWTTNAANNTITDFDGTPINGQALVVLESDGGTVLDCTASGLKCGTADITMAADDVASFVYDGTDWILTSYVDQGDDLGSDATGSGSLGTNLSSTTDDILSDNGTLRLGGTGGTNNEDLDFDFETTANEVGVSSSTGATQINLGSLGMLTTGDIRGHVHLVTTTGTTDSPSADEMRGTFHVSNNASGTDYTLPTAVAGMSACFYDLNGGGVVTLDANTGDVIYLDGTALDAGDAIDSAGALGDFICLLAIDATNWLTLGRSGTWVDGGVD